MFGLLENDISYWAFVSLTIFSKSLYTSNKTMIAVMNHDEPDFEKKLQRFSVVKECPKCRQLSLSFKENKISCSNCGYEEKVPTIR